jgi:hypothetical protein
VRLLGLPGESRLWRALAPAPETDDSVASIDSDLGIVRRDTGQ